MERNRKHLSWIASLPCSVPHCRTGQLVVAAHVRVLGTDGGTGLKPSDLFTAPLCALHHLEQHRIGHRAFDARHGISLLSIAVSLAAESPWRGRGAGRERAAAWDALF